MIFCYSSLSEDTQRTYVLRRSFKLEVFYLPDLSKDHVTWKK